LHFKQVVGVFRLSVPVKAANCREPLVSGADADIIVLFQANKKLDNGIRFNVLEVQSFGWDTLYVAHKNE